MNNYYPSRSDVDKLKAEYPAGTRIRLIHMDDPQAPPVGTLGVVSCVDDMGTIHTRWDTGSCLGALYGEDAVEKVDLIRNSYRDGPTRPCKLRKEKNENQ